MPLLKEKIMVRTRSIRSDLSLSSPPNTKLRCIRKDLDMSPWNGGFPLKEFQVPIFWKVYTLLHNVFLHGVVPVPYHEGVTLKELRNDPVTFKVPTFPGGIVPVVPFFPRDWFVVVLGRP